MARAPATKPPTLVPSGAGTLLRELFGQFAERPDPRLEAALDAAVHCFARRGVAHTSLLDIARHLGVSKATAYRQVGSIDDALRLVVARELHDLLEELDVVLSRARGVDLVLVPALAITRRVREHPVFQKLLADEPHLAGELLPAVVDVFDVATGLLKRYLAVCMRAGEIRSGDPDALADLIGRLMLVALILPPRDLKKHFRTALLPHLEPV
ncbi:MAG: TetR/AcrR family transcriptional regulator [Acidimicrobiales bacterium]